MWFLHYTYTYNLSNQHTPTLQLVWHSQPRLLYSIIHTRFYAVFWFPQGVTLVVQAAQWSQFQIHLSGLEKKGGNYNIIHERNKTSHRFSNYKSEIPLCAVSSGVVLLCALAVPFLPIVVSMATCVWRSRSIAFSCDVTRSEQRQHATYVRTSV